MTKDVIVTVKGFQFAEEQDEIETVCEGEYFEVKDSQFVVYEEKIDGYDKTINNRIKIKPNEITVTKKGPYQVQMIFEEGKKTRSQYMTPYGCIMLEMDTRKVEVKSTDEQIELLIEYGLDANEQFVSDCKIVINIKQKK